jgi:hypothetical protein
MLWDRRSDTISNQVHRHICSALNKKDMFFSNKFKTSYHSAVLGNIESMYLHTLMDEIIYKLAISSQEDVAR